MKALIISGMDNETIISFEINENFLYHLHSGIQSIKELRTKLEGYPLLKIDMSLIIRFSTYKLGKEFSRELEKGNIELPEDGIEYLLVNDNRNIVFTEEQKKFISWKVIEYPYKYYLDPSNKDYFINLESVETKYSNCRLIIEMGYFFIELYDELSNESLIGYEILYSDFEKEIIDDLNLNYIPKKKYGIDKNLKN